LEFCCAESFLSGCNKGDGHHPGSYRQVAVFHDCAAFDTGPETTRGTLKRLLVIKPVMLATSTSFTADSMLHSLLLYIPYTRSFVRKSIDEIDNVHGQNRLF
jgi:hypothetical protein